LKLLGNYKPSFWLVSSTLFNLLMVIYVGFSVICGLTANGNNTVFYLKTKLFS